MQWTPTRSAALQHLSDFLPDAGRRYADTRNHDNGPGRTNVSQLSPWLHAGLLSEHEVLAATLDAHSARSAEKFISEVFWRVYFKGYLEQRPSVWSSYTEGRDAALAAIDSNAGLRTAYEQATEGRTGIVAFDTWARELVETGYLHNHARMWFASIWIFTLKLDWHLGADFFLRHLMDGDAASNTLSWRWVAGLHTKGKTYLARPGNIARYTADHPEGPLEAEGLADEAEALTEAQEHGRQPLDLPDPATPQAPYALLLHDEAASHVPLDLPTPPALVIAAARPDARSPLPCGDHARQFAQQAVANGAREAGETFGCDVAEWTRDTPLQSLLAERRITTLACPYLPTGWTRDALQGELDSLPDSITLLPLLGDLDRAAWPHAKAGFFGVKKQIAAVMGEVGLPG
ncbi:FAD-binding domain-containing protein [Qipengyuania sp. DSG2-2]|uniref:FAD-binding domain-containing protein n=1 Tax=Qipengyuania sp. DGS2-2 TaxID=3349631 RepID=UPI0036D29E63